MNRQQRRQYARDVAYPLVMAGAPDLDLPFVMTDPGCDAPTHASEVMGFSMAVAMGADLDLVGWHEMDCGCSMRVFPLG